MPGTHKVGVDKRALILLLMLMGFGCSAYNGDLKVATVDEGAFYRGPQPDIEELEQLRERGIRTVIDMRRDRTPVHRERVESLGMHYINIPSRAEEPSDDDLARILSIATDPRMQPVFVHCKVGRDRTGTVAALYRMVVQGWTAEQAIDELHHFQGFNALLFPNIPDYLRSVNVSDMREAIRHAELRRSDS